MARIDKSKPVILLDHQPYQLAESQAAGIDLQFSGHTHHGQVWPMNWVTDHLYEQVTAIANGKTAIYMFPADYLYGDLLSE